MRPEDFNGTLLSLPLFMGMSRSDLREVAGKTRFDFQKPEAGEMIAQEGAPCTRLHFLLDGDITVTTYSEDHGYRIEEDILAPEIFQTERIFGLRQHYTHTYTARKGCAIMSIEKREVMMLAERFDIFRINLLGAISTQTQKMHALAFRMPPVSLEQRIIRFFEAHSSRPAGEKTFYIKMNRLAEEVGDSRRDVSHALNQLQDDGLLSLHRGRIHIPALEKLLDRA